MKWLGRLVGSPAFPTPTFPWLGLGGFLPLPVKFRIHFGEPMRFEGDPSEDDAAIEERVETVKEAIGKLLGGLAERGAGSLAELRPAAPAPQFQVPSTAISEGSPSGRMISTETMRPAVPRATST
jgi:hypothetical protein